MGAKPDHTDNLQLLSCVQRQLVHKSFQTRAFEAKLKAKYREEERSVTPGEVLQQALRTHAASIASLHVEDIPSTDGFRQRQPKKSLGRLQYEDMGRMPALLTEAQNDPNGSPSPRQRVQCDGGGGASGADGSAGDSSAPGASAASSPKFRYRPNPTAQGLTLRGSLSGAVGGAPSRLPRAGPPGGGTAGAATSTAAAATAADHGGDDDDDDGPAVALCRSSSALWRSDQLLLALRDAPGSPAGSPALPHLQLQPHPRQPVPNLKLPDAVRSTPNSPAAKYRQAGVGGGGGGAGGSGGGYVPRQLVQAIAAVSAAQDYLLGKSGSSLTGSQHRLQRGVSSQLPTAVTHYPDSPIRKLGSSAMGDEPEVELAVSRSGPSFSFGATRQPARGATGGGSGGSAGLPVRPQAASTNGMVSIRQPRTMRFGSVFAASADGAVDGAVAAAAAAATGSVAVGANCAVLTPSPPALPPPPAEDLFARVSRSTIRAGPQQEWVATFDEPLTSPSVFNTASCGASPYSAHSLLTHGLPPGSHNNKVVGASGVAAGLTAARAPGGGSHCGSRLLPSGSMHTPRGTLLTQAPRAASPSAFTLPPLRYTASGGAATTAGEGPPDRLARMQSSLSCSATDGAAAVQNSQQLGSPGPPLSGVSVSRTASSNTSAARAAPGAPEEAEEAEEAEEGEEEFVRVENCSAGGSPIHSCTSHKERATSSNGYYAWKADPVFGADGGVNAISCGLDVPVASVAADGAAAAAAAASTTAALTRSCAMSAPRDIVRRQDHGIDGGGGGGGGELSSSGEAGVKPSKECLAEDEASWDSEEGDEFADRGSQSIMTRMRRALGNLWTRGSP